MSQFQIRIAELERQVKASNTASEGAEKSSTGDKIKIIWKEGGKAPVKYSSDYNAVVDSTTLYIRRISDVYAYTVSTFT